MKFGMGNVKLFQLSFGEPIRYHAIYGDRGENTFGESDFVGFDPARFVVFH